MPPLAAEPWAGADLRGLLDFARAIEDLGFDSLWANDSLMRPRIEALTFLSAAAAVVKGIACVSGLSGIVGRYRTGKGVGAANWQRSAAGLGG